MVKEPKRKRLKRAKPPKRGFRASYKHAVVILGCAAVLGAGVYVFLTSRPTFIRVGESMTYGIYVGGTRVGSLTSQVTGTTIVENAECYVAQYSLVIGSAARSGVLKFDMEGNLRRAVIAEAENDWLKWKTEIGYSFADSKMRVVVYDNRNPDAYDENDTTFENLTNEIMVPEHIWYLLRFGPLHKYYRREFFINALPDGILNFGVAVKVVGEESVETKAGSFDSWVLEVENAQLDTAWGSQGDRLTTWPIYKLWVAKNEGFVVKAWQDGTPIEYILESKA